MAVISAVIVIVAIAAAPHHPAQAQSTVPNISLNGIYNGGGIASVQLSLSGSGPFTENFQVAVCFQEQGRNGNRIDCAHTPWAASSTPSDMSYNTVLGVPNNITDSNYSKWWSDWSAAPQQSLDANWTATNVVPNYFVDWEEYNYGSGWYEVEPSLFMRTAPLSTGQIITNVQLGFEQIDVNDINQMYNAANTVIDANTCSGAPANGVVPWVITPIGGGNAVGTIGVQGSGNVWSFQDPGASYAYTYGNCAAAGSYGSGQVTNSGPADYFRVYLAAGAYNAANPNNNIPTSTTPSTKMTIGTNGSPLTFTIQNTGSAPWTSNIKTFVSSTGVCDGGGTQPDPTQGHPVGTACVSTYSNSSNIFQLAHVSGMFGTGLDPLRFSQSTQETCSIGSTMGCADSSCNSDSQACQSSGYCSNSGVTDQSQCWESGGSWTQGCNSQWVNQVSCTQTGGDSSVEPGQTATFKLPSLTAPATPRNYTEQWQMKNGSASFGSVIPVNIQVGPGNTPSSVATNTITVTSQNAVTQGPVNATWDITDMGSGPLPATDPSFLNYDGDVCDLVGNTLCHGSSQTYTNQPAVNTAMPSVSYGSVTMVTSSIALYNPADSSLYSFNSVRVTPATQKKVGVIDTLLSLTKSVFGSTAEAWVLQQSAAQTLTATQPVNYTILWDPTANIAVSSTSPLSLTSVVGNPASGQVQITNNGAPGSQIASWSQTVTYTNGSGWLSVSPPSSAVPMNQGDTQTVTINVSSTGLSAGTTYKAKIDFTGTGQGSSASDAYLDVSYAVTASPSSVTGVTITGCSPSSIDTNGTSNCTATVSGTGNYDNTVTWSSSIGTMTSTGGDSAKFASSNPGTATIKACSTSSPSICDTTPVVVTQAPIACTPGVNCPKCTDPIISAAPTSIVIPESSVLSYKCDNVTSCTLTGNDGSNYTNNLKWVDSTTASGTQSVTPLNTTVYTFSCTNSGYSPQSATVSLPVKVTVGGTSRCEQNPNGAGCPGQ